MSFKKNTFQFRGNDVSSVKTKNGKQYTVRNNRTRFFFPDEWMTFYDSIKSRRQKITFDFLISTGARINEVRHIKVNDVDMIRGNIILRITKQIINRPKIQKKGMRKVRIIVVSDEFIKRIKKYIKEYNLKDEDYFPILKTGPANLALKKSLQKIKIQDWQMFSIHNIRKTSENWLISCVDNPIKIIKQFGHSTNVASKFYISPDIFPFEDRREIKMILGNLIDKLNSKMN